jgi:hypothetical protein
MTTTASNRPTHRLYAVAKKPNGENGKWAEIGAAWPHKDGNGFNLRVNYLPLNGAELVLRIPAEKTEADPAAATPAEFEGGF